MTEMMLFAYGPNHTRLRNSVADAFTPRNVNRYRELMRDVVSGLLFKPVDVAQIERLVMR